MAIDRSELARRLRVARDALGLTQQDVAERIDLSRSAVAQVELGNREVSSFELQQFAELYARDLRSFFEESFEEREPVTALFRAHPDIHGQPELESAVQECVALGRELTELEALLSVEPEVAGIAAYPQSPPRKTWEAVQQGGAVACEERRRLGLADSPIPSVIDLLESQGIRTAQILMPGDISGISLFAAELGVFVVSNSRHSHERRRFSYAHEYAHVLCDRDQPGFISRARDRDDLREVRANAFAATFLMPEGGIREAVRSMGKGNASRMQAEVFDGVEAIEVRARSTPGSQEIQLYDVALLAHQFGTSRAAMLYRLRNLNLLKEARLEELKEQDRLQGKVVARLLDLPLPDEQSERSEFRHRFLGLSLEAWRREEITLDKLIALAGRIGLEPDEVRSLLEEVDLLGDQGEEAPLIPLVPVVV